MLFSHLAYIRLNFRYILSRDFVVSETGIIAKNSTKVQYSRIQTVDLRISLIGRIFNFGTIELSTAGESGAELLMQNVHRPVLLQSAIEARMRQAKLSVD